MTTLLQKGYIVGGGACGPGASGQPHVFDGNIRNGGSPETNRAVRTASHRYRPLDARPLSQLPRLVFPNIAAGFHLPCLGRPHSAGAPSFSSSISCEVKTSLIDVATALKFHQMHVVCTYLDCSYTSSFSQRGAVHFTVLLSIPAGKI